MGTAHPQTQLVLQLTTFPYELSPWRHVYTSHTDTNTHTHTYLKFIMQTTHAYMQPLAILSHIPTYMHTHRLTFAMQAPHTHRYP